LFLPIYNTFYQIPGASHEPENTQTTENATEQVYIYLPLPTSKFQSHSQAIFYPTMGTTSLIYLVISCFYQFIIFIRSSYTFYQVPGTSPEPENTQKTENATEQVYINLPLPTSKFQSRSQAIFYPTMGTTGLIYLVIPCFYQFIIFIRSSYTFYQIPGTSHEPENIQTTEKATEQVFQNGLKFRV
jgi:hypothetical protein